MNEDTAVLVNRFFSEHPEHIVGYTTKKAGGKDFVTMDYETARAFAYWLMADSGLPKEVRDLRILEIDRLYGKVN